MAMMNRRVLVSSVVVALTTATSGPALAGQLQPPTGAVAPTGANVISQDTSFPLVIDEPGTYVFLGSVTVPADSDGIRIAANGVTIDLRGFSFSGAGSSGTGIAPAPLAGGEGIVEYRGATVKNGTLLGWPDAGIVTGVAGPQANDASMLSSGNFRDLHIQGLGEFGVEAGPIVNNFVPIANTFERISVNGMTSTGLDAGFSSVVVDCKVTECGVGIIANESRITGCYVAFSASVGISADTTTIEQCVSVRNGTVGISAIRCLVRGNTARLNTTSQYQNIGTNATVENRF